MEECRTFTNDPFIHEKLRSPRNFRDNLHMSLSLIHHQEKNSELREDLLMYAAPTGAEAGMSGGNISLPRSSHLPVMGHIHYVPSADSCSEFIFIKR